MNKNVWLFIDIDGCIMNNMFNNVFYTNDQEKIINIVSAYQKSRCIGLYPEFIEFYKRVVDNKDYEITDITFITGRQENCFGWLTDMQLKLLEKIHWFDVRYFYNHSKHTWKIYRSFKVHTVLDSIQYSNFKGMIKIYDDLNLQKEFQEALDKDFEFYIIRDKEDWNRYE